MRATSGAVSQGRAGIAARWAAVLVALVALIAPASAAASGWSAPTRVDPELSPSSVSCTDSSFCVGVGDTDTGPVATIYDGSGWSPLAPLPFGGSGVGVLGVSCASTSFCVAVADNYSDGGAGSASTYDGSSWSTPVSIDPTGVSAVSCPTSSFCVAVDYDGNAVTYHDGTWGAPVSIDSVAGGNLTAVSCVSAAFCVAVDGAGDEITDRDGVWGQPAEIDSANSLGPGFLTSVSCPTPSFCVATDNSGGLLTYDGSAWSAPKFLVNTPTQAVVSCTSASFCMASLYGESFLFNGQSWRLIPPARSVTDMDFQALSCVAGSFCGAIDGDGNGFTYHHGSWSEPVALSGGPDGLTDISCGSATMCFALDSNGRLVRYVNGAWGTPVISDRRVLTSVSCPSDSFCMAVTNAGDKLTFNGTSWSAPVDADGDVAFHGVSCVSGSFCVAIARNGVLTYNGTTWSAPYEPAGFRDGASAVSCVSATFCVASDILGDVSIYDGTAWGAVTTPPDLQPGVTALACSSTTFCLEGDQYGDLDQYDGSTWTSLGQVIPSFTSSGGQNFLTVIACVPDSTSCFITDTNGDVRSDQDGTWQGPQLATPLTDLACPTAAFCAGVSGEDGLTYTAPASDAPQVATDAATDVTGTSAVLNGTVNPEGSNVTSCSFDWGTSSGVFTHTAPCSTMPGSGTTPVSVSASISQLVPGTMYHFRLVAVNATGGATATEQRFYTTTSYGHYTFGNASVGDDSAAFPANLEVVNPNDLYEAGTTTSMEMYLQPSGVHGSQEIQLLIYADSDGIPGALLGQTPKFYFLSSDPAGWYKIDLTQTVSLATGQYWIGAITGGTAGVADYLYDATGTRDTRSTPFAGGPTNPFGATGQDTAVISLYVNMDPPMGDSPAEVRQARAAALRDHTPLRVARLG